MWNWNGSLFLPCKSREMIANNAKVYPRSGDTLYLGLIDGTITFKGEVKVIYSTFWN